MGLIWLWAIPGQYMWNEDLIWFMLHEDGDLGEHIGNHGNADHVDLGDI